MANVSCALIPDKSGNGKIHSQVLHLKETIKKNIPGGITAFGAGDKLVQLSNDFIKVNSIGQVQLYIKYIYNKDQLVKDIINVGGRVEIISEKTSTIQAWLPYDKIDGISAKDYVDYIDLPDYAVVHKGSVTTEGDAVLKADTIKTSLGYYGANVKVGVISDGINGIALSQASGDIPSAYEAQSARADGNLNAGAEGLAMMEIVHDIAPSAPLAFSNPNTSLEMLNAIQILDQTLNCKVIVDDLGFFGQPWFEDGAIADQANTAVTHGKIYISAAGNSGFEKYHESDYMGMAKTIGGVPVEVQDFNGTGDWHLRMRVPAGATARVYLQWNDKFGQSNNDYDLILTDDAGTTIYAISDLKQDGMGIDDPYEWASVTNSGVSSANVYIVVRKYSGANKRLKIITYGGSLDEYSTSVGSIWGHQSAENVFAIGAIDHATPDQIESFSSQGPVRVDFPSQGFRQKPDLCGIDGVSVTGNGGFTNHFYGTSAAAPHIAGLAALIWGANSSLSSTQVKNILKYNCVDLGAPGYENIYGFGRPDASTALPASVSTTPLPIPTINAVPSIVNISNLTITGTKSANSANIFVNNSSSEVVYLTSTAWSATVHLTAGSNSIYVKAADVNGNVSGTAAVSVTLQQMQYADSSTGTTVDFPLDSTMDVPTMSAAVYTNPAQLGSFPPSRKISGNAINFQCNVANFLKPVTVTMKMDSGTLNPGVYYWDAAANSWSTSGINIVSKTATSITFTTTHFTIFSVFGVSGLLSDVLVYPNPFKIGSSSGIIFDGLAGNETIKIYTIAGELVVSYKASGGANWTWNAKNAAGRQVARGIYIYMVANNAGLKRIGKAAVLD